MIVVWIFFMIKLVRHVRHRDAEQKRHNEALEKILTRLVEKGEG